MEIQYIGENLLPRQIGHFAVVLSFVAAVFTTLTYFFATRSQMASASTEGPDAWKNLGRWGFGVHSAAVMTVIGSIFYVMITKRFEYFYAHSHVDGELPFKYVFAAFWEGQEGSFLLWMFWHVGLGAWIILRGRGSNSQLATWEAPVIAVLASVQVFLSSMILGLHFGWGEHVIKWGSNPILLLREANDAPIFAQADYVSKIAGTARGLNPLLQNYWMTIHPPTLFLGFASTTIPFCFAIAGLWTKRFNEWTKPALPYALFSAAILGTGILMGGAWAYEALSFNGYWAWDPVENMSLVPWLVLVAGIHTHLIARATGHSLRATFAFYILTFLLVLYSTFLTRSGILGDTSAHAFTEMGLEWQLVLFQMTYVVLGFWLLFKHYGKIPNPEKEEAVSSREFWMFIGSLVLLLSVVLISFTTSIPVYNKIFEYMGGVFGFKAPHFTAPVDVVAHYNKTQLWIGVFIGVLSGFAQFLRYKEFNFAGYQKTFWKHIAISSLASVVLTGAIVGTQVIEIKAWQYVLLLFAGIFTLLANGEYIVAFLRNNLKASGSAFAHLGFGIMVVGIMASGINKRWISSNRFAMEGLINFTEEQFNKNVLVFKGLPMMINGYEVSYESDTAYGNRRDYTLIFRKKDQDFKKTLDSFTVHPYVLYDKKSGKIASTNPDTRHFLTYDVFSHIAALPPVEQDPEIAHQEEDSLKYQPLTIGVGESVQPKITDAKTPQYSVEVEGLDMQPKHPKYKPEEKDVAIGVNLRIRRGKDSVYSAKPIVFLRGENVFQVPVTVNEIGARVKLEPEIFDRLFAQRKVLAFKQGDSKDLGSGLSATFTAIDPNPSVRNFQLQQGDIAFSAKLDVKSPRGNFSAQPVYVIRGTQAIPLADNVETLGLSFNIAKVDPNAQEVFIEVIDKTQRDVKVPLSIAEGASRTDYIVLEATINPGINLVWIGSILMMFGLGMAMFYRIK